jgi:hypothetical protein
MAEPKQVVVKQDDAQPIAVEILAQSVLNLEKAAKRIEQSGLTTQAIALLLWDALPAKNCPTRAQISAVLTCLPRLAEIYTRRKRGSN